LRRAKAGTATGMRDAYREELFRDPESNSQAFGHS